MQMSEKLFAVFIKNNNDDKDIIRENFNPKLF